MKYWFELKLHYESVERYERHETTVARPWGKRLPGTIILCLIMYSGH